MPSTFPSFHYIISALTRPNSGFGSSFHDTHLALCHRLVMKYYLLHFLGEETGMERGAHMLEDTLVNQNIGFEPKSLDVKCNVLSAFLVSSKRNPQNISCTNLLPFHYETSSRVLIIFSVTQPFRKFQRVYENLTSCSHGESSCLVSKERLKCPGGVSSVLCFSEAGWGGVDCRSLVDLWSFPHQWR